MHLALLGMGMESAIQRGENAGRNSVHEFVVLAQQAWTGSESSWRVTRPTAALSARRYALVAWVSAAVAAPCSS